MSTIVWVEMYFKSECRPAVVVGKACFLEKSPTRSPRSMSGLIASIEFFFGMLKSLTDLLRLRMSREAQLVGERRLRHRLK